MLKNLQIRKYTTWDGREGTIYSFDGVMHRIYLWVVDDKVVNSRLRKFGQ